MKRTHQLINREETVTAWQFDHAAPIPVWVARKFHRIGEEFGISLSEGWQAIAPNGEIVEAKPTDWAMVIGNSIIVLNDSEFQMLFKPILAT